MAVSGRSYFRYYIFSNFILNLFNPLSNTFREAFNRSYNTKELIITNTILSITHLLNLNLNFKKKLTGIPWWWPHHGIKETRHRGLIGHALQKTVTVPIKISSYLPDYEYYLNTFLYLVKGFFTKKTSRFDGTFQTDQSLYFSLVVFVKATCSWLAFTKTTSPSAGSPAVPRKKDGAGQIKKRRFNLIMV